MRRLLLTISLLFALAGGLLAQEVALPTHGLDEHQHSWAQTEPQVQVFTLNTGFNWWSPFVDLGDNGLAKLEACLGDKAQLIKSQSSFITYNATENSWTGSMSTIDNTSTYFILLDAETSEFTLEGALLSPENTEITVNSGWNWIGFPSSTAIPINQAMANYPATGDDLLKGQSGYATYSATQQQWIGSLTELTPGQGYMLMSNSAEPISFTFAPAQNNPNNNPVK